ncbi:MAG: AmmeMemoRadiSam system protein B [candidate division Zixibacteria bacterium]|nr:AmmeMemoRadiSam system protein B [candidate division Zixibacteria bacterium]
MSTVSDIKKIRQPRFAAVDSFYDNDPVALTKQIAGFFARAERVALDGDIGGLICPHAGYAYSGEVAAAAYKQLEGLSYDTVVIISPSHQVFFRGASIYSGGAYRTPLGDVPLDLDLCARLTSVDSALSLSDLGHDASGGGWEHALEVHLPFLQIVLGHFALVPIVMGDQEYPTARLVGELIGRHARPGRTLVIASSDLAHGHDYATTRRLDDTAAAAVGMFDPSEFYDQYSTGAFEACGGGPITAAMIAARALGADRAQVISRRNSADVTGQKQGYIVGYLSAVMYRSGSERAPVQKTVAKRGLRLQMDVTLTGSEREMLHTTARRSLEAAVKGARLECPEAPTQRLQEKRGVFVTLTAQGHLRGCVGYVRPYKPLVDAVWEMAESAARRDHRFLPVEPSEVDGLEIEITVLSPLQKIANPDQVLVGRHGVIVSQGHQAGVLLPQVPIENDWDRETFLSHACEKAGLHPDAWKDKRTTIEIFTAEVF